MLSLLAPSGYQAAEEDAYRTIRFRHLDRRAYEVGPTFPRLVPENLANPADADRLLSVHYTLDLTDRNAEPKPLDFAAAAVNALAEAIR